MHGSDDSPGLRGMARVAARARWELRSEAGRFPSIYLPAIRWRYRAGQFQIPLADDTELVIDGFLRSGTTFVLSLIHI